MHVWRNKKNIIFDYLIFLEAWTRQSKTVYKGSFLFVGSQMADIYQKSFHVSELLFSSLLCIMSITHGGWKCQKLKFYQIYNQDNLSGRSVWYFFKGLLQIGLMF